MKKFIFLMLKVVLLKTLKSLLMVIGIIKTALHTINFLKVK